MNWAWLRALGTVYAAPYEIARHPLGDHALQPHEYYAAGRNLRRTRLRLRDGPALLAPAKGGTGNGVLVFESDLLGPVVGAEDTRPFTPVLLIDGEPAATGFGRADLLLAPGPHLVELQSGASAGYWPVDLPPGGTVRLTGFTRQRLHPAGGAPALLRSLFLIPTAAAPARLGRRFTMYASLIGALVGFLALALPLADAALGKTPGLLLAGGAALAGAIAGSLLAKGIERLVLRAAERRLAGGVRTATHRPTAFPGGSWRPVDPRDTTAPRTGEGMAALRLTLAYVQTPHAFDPGRGSRPPLRRRWRMGEEVPVRVVGPNRYDPRRPVDETDEAKAAGKRRSRFGETYPPEVRPWVAAPVVRIDGEPVPSLWGVNEYRLQPGRHRIAVEIPPPPELLAGERTEVELEPGLVRTVDLSLDGTASIEAVAFIEITSDAEGQQLTRYLGSFSEN
ncbi:hypothetical protein SAMN05216298_3391 [Glycomyces sambucus]|uniref:Uncharacterized protein n=1 Tax=Glycomyces sambucus TaxID=380244 RepID=A0A1G9J3Q0_9ACTN|nr:hypothetical protein [Glycomyces sambucus]SDL31935.1 hypothetical protein SAMN05216298_3391 [Glycomyces sambucus]